MPRCDRRFGLAAAAMAAVVGAVFWRATLLSGFESIPGDIGDGRFNLAVLEHWYRVATAGESWTSPNWYWPQSGVLGYSDSLALLAPPYVGARLAGLDVVAAAALAQMAAWALGFAGMAALLARGLGLVPVAALAGAAAFAGGSALYQSLTVGHLQMIGVEAVPWFALFALLWLRDGRAAWSAAAALTLAALLSTAFYVGWFTVLATVVAGVLALARAPRSALSALAARKASLAVGVAVLAVALVPFALVYGPVAAHSPPRPWAEAVRSLPDLPHLLEARGNALWGPVAAALWPEAAGRGGELGKGFSWGLLALFLGSLGWLAARGSSAGSPFTRRFAVILGVTVLLCWLLMLRIGEFSAWTAVYRWFPAGGSIRSVFRFNLVLAVPVMVVAATGLDGLWRAGGRRRWCGAALAALVVVEQLNLSPGVLSRARHIDSLDRVPAAPAVCRSFVLMGANPAPEYRRWSRQISAVLIAQARGIPTLNGYSGMAPPGWRLFDPTDRDGYRRAVAEWAESHGVKDGLCGLDLEAGQWLEPGTLPVR